MLAEDVLAGPALRVASREDGRESANDLPVLRIRRATLLVSHLELFQDLTRGFETGSEVLGRDVTLTGGVGDPTELGRLYLQPGGQLGVELRVQSAERVESVEGFRLFRFRLPAAEHHQHAHGDTDARSERRDQDVIDHPVTFP
jgi:hypothetical protein